MTSKDASTGGDNVIQPVTSAQAATNDDGIDKAKADASGANDAAAQFLATVGPFPPMTPEEEKKLVRKIDRWMIPLVRCQHSRILFSAIAFRQANLELARIAAVHGTLCCC